MSHPSAFHPYTRPAQPVAPAAPAPPVAPAAPPAPIDTPIEESLRFLFSSEALLALTQLQNSSKGACVMDASKQQVSPPSVAPILTPNPVESLQSPTVSNLPYEKSRRKRTTFSPEQATRLEAEYLSDSYMAREKRLMLARSLHLSENQVKTWFQNRRAKDKRDRKTDNSSHHSRKSSPSRKSSSDSSPAPSSVSSFVLPPQIHTATAPTTVESLYPPSTPPLRTIQKVEQFPTQQHLANLLVPGLDSFNTLLQTLSSTTPFPPAVQNMLVSSPPPLFNPNLLASFQSPLQSATI